jgi:DhnA family fructose-bisphosphate aldolase class Ia
VVSACPVPLVAIGGEKKVRERDFLNMVSDIMQTGAYGISVGRNVFQYKKPGNMIKAITQIVHKGFAVSTAVSALSEEPLESAILSHSVIW